MDSASELAKLIALIYDAALEPGLWSELLASIAGQTGSRVTQLALRGASNGIMMLEWAGTETSFIRAYEDRFAAGDVLVPAVSPMACGTVLPQRASPASWLERSEVYQDWARLQGLCEVLALKFLHESGTLGMLVCSWGDADHSKTEPDAPQLLAQLAPHLQRAMRVRLRMDALSAERRAAIDALDLLAFAVFLLDAQSRIQFANRAAEALLRCSDGIRAVSNHLQATKSTRTRQLQALVARAAGLGQEVAVGGAVRIERPSLKRAYQVLVSPLTARPSWAAVTPHGAAVVVLVIDPELAHTGVEEQLRAVYSLTPAEARLACALGKGEGINAVAEMQGVLPSTARTHLHHVFQKTETRNQAELVRFIDQMPLMRPREGR